MTKRIVYDLIYDTDGEYRCIYVNDHVAPEVFREQAAELFKAEVEVGSVASCYARWCGVFEDRRLVGNYLDCPVEPKRGAFMITYSEQFTCPELDGEVE